MHKFKKTLFQLTFLLVLPFMALADTPQTSNPPININIPNPTNVGSDLMSVLVALLNKVVMPIAAIAVVLFIIWAGFSFLMAQGKPEEIRKAKNQLLWALIGAGILLGAAGISAVVETTVREVVNLQ